MTQAIKSNFYWRVFTHFTFKINVALSLIPLLKFSVNFEEFSWRRTFPLKIFCLLLCNAPFVSHNHFKVYVWPIFLFFWLHISFEGIMFDGWRHFFSFICAFEVQTFQRKCGTQRNLTNILQILQRTLKALCLRQH